MFDYTKTTIKNIEKDIKCLAFLCSITTQLIYMAYLIYALCTDRGVFTVNIILLVLSTIYLAFYIYANLQEFKAKTKRIVRIIFKRCKQFIRVYTLGVMIYGLCITAGNASITSILLTVFMVLGFIADILFEILIRRIVKRSKMFVEAIKADFQEANPIHSFKNFFRKMTGKEVYEEPSEERQILDEEVEQVRNERKNERLEKKYLAKQKKEQRKAEKKAQKRAQKGVTIQPPSENSEDTFF
jgi:uncharacterized membrane protein YobD (UPF0266 family)